MGRCEPQNATQVYLVYGAAALGLLILFAAGVPILVLANGQRKSLISLSIQCELQPFIFLAMTVAGAVLIGVGGLMVIGAVVTFSIWCRLGLRSIH